MHTSTLSAVNGLVLAGGRGRRVGGRDKGLIDYHGQPMVKHVIAAIEPDVDGLMISANRNIATYQAFGFPVLVDELDDFQGPLSGLLTGLRHCPGEWLLVAPCDLPLLPTGLAGRLTQAIQSSQSSLAVVHDGQRLHPLCALLNTRLIESLENYLQTGQRRVITWLESQNPAIADYSDTPHHFTNINKIGDTDEL